MADRGLQPVLHTRGSACATPRRRAAQPARAPAMRIGRGEPCAAAPQTLTESPFLSNRWGPPQTAPMSSISSTSRCSGRPVFPPLGECGGFAGDRNGKHDCAPPVHVARLPDDSSLAVSKRGGCRVLRCALKRHGARRRGAVPVMLLQERSFGGPLRGPHAEMEARRDLHRLAPT